MSRARFGTVDRALHALFSDRADARRHDGDRKRYRATTMRTDFSLYLARVYGLSWLAFAVAAAVVGSVVAALAPATYGGLAGPAAALPAWLPVVPQGGAALLVAAGAGLAAKHATVRVGGLYLRWVARARRVDIERTLPGAVRYLRALAAGSADETAMLRKVAAQERSYGETAAACRAVVNTATLTGSLDAAVRRVARDTPSQDALAPFLLKFREHAAQGPDAVENYLEMEARMLGRRQSREREQAEGFLELLAELFIVLLVLPTLLVIVLTVLAVLAPGLGRPVTTPLGTTSVRVALVWASAGFVLAVGGLTAWLVHAIRPPNVTVARHERSDGALSVVRGATTNPADAAVACLPLAALVAAALWSGGAAPANVALLGYAAYGLPVGLVALRRARRDEAKDREIKDLVHAVSGHVSLGRPLPAAVAAVSEEVDLGPLDEDVANLAFNLQLTARGDDVRAAALDRFVADVGTALARQTVGLVTGALDAGSDPETVFGALQAEIGRLYHAKRALRANLLVYVAVGWTTALLVVGVMVAVNLFVLPSFARLAAVSGSMGGYVLDPSAVDPARDQHRFYVVTQATMLACGWFAGYASRDRYEALLHSAALVAVAFVVFTGVGAA